MATSKATTVAQYLAELPDDRREVIAAVRDAVNAGLPDGYEEVMQYGMISWVVPLSRYPDTYNGQPLTVASLANQKRHMALYLMGVYADEGERAWFEGAWKAAGPKLDMGKSCVRFTRLDGVALDVVTEAIARTPVETFVERYERARAGTASAKKKRSATKKSKKSAAKKPSAKKPSAKKPKESAAKKPSAKKSSAKKKPSVGKGAAKKRSAKKAAGKKRG